MSLIKKNISSALKNYPDLADCLKNLPEPPTVENASNGQITVSIKGRRLSGKVNPVAEGEKFARALCANNPDKILVFGLGLGYHLEAIFNLFPNTLNLAVIEPNIEIISAAMHHRDLTPLFNNDRFQLIADIKDADICRKLSIAIEAEGDNWEIGIHHPSYRQIPDNFPGLKASFELLLNNRRYKSLFEAQEKLNIKQNVKAVHAAPGISKLFGKLNGKPAVLVGAGPSLDRSLPFLSRLQDYCFILAVDTAFKPLEKNGIKADMILSVDPQPLSAIHFNESAPKPPLAFLPTTHPGAVDLFEGNRFVMVKEGSSFFEKAEGFARERGTVSAGGSVSCFALELLLKTGADPIFVAGQDFAFSQGIPYNRDTVNMLEGEDIAINEKTDVIASRVMEHENLNVEMCDGRTGRTHANLLSYLRDFEEYIAKAPGRKFININSTGAKIRGAENMASWGEIEKKLDARLDKPIFPDCLY